MHSDTLYNLETVFEAIRRGDVEFVQKAIDVGFDPNTEDSERRTPLILAAEFQHPAIVRLLLTHGADPLHEESNGYDALNAAAFFGEWRMGAYTDESAEIQAILRAHIEPPSAGLFARALGWIKRAFPT